MVKKIIMTISVFMQIIAGTDNSINNLIMDANHSSIQQPGTDTQTISENRQVHTEKRKGQIAEVFLDANVSYKSGDMFNDMSEEEQKRFKLLYNVLDLIY